MDPRRRYLWRCAHQLGSQRLPPQEGHATTGHDACRICCRKFDLDAGTAAQFFGLTAGAKTSVNLFTKRYLRYIPDTPFCAGV
jgi:hypothetical protein